MHATAAPTLEHWHEFYLLLGTAAAALVALLFVAVSVAAGFIGAQRATGSTGGISTYLSPVVFHFSALIILSLNALVPVHTALSLSVVLGAAGLVGTGYAGTIAVRVMRHDAADIPDRLGYGIIPAASYLACIAAAVFIGLGSQVGPMILAGAAAALLLDNMRNAWDLMLSLSHRANEAPHISDKPPG